MVQDKWAFRSSIHVTTPPRYVRPPEVRQEILERLVRVLHARDLDPKEEFELRDQRDDDACPRACVRWVLVRYNKAAIRLGMRRPTISPRNMPPHTHTHTRTRAVARDHDGIRDVVDDGAEAEDAEPDLEHAGQEAELERGRQAHGLGVALWGFGVERKRASGLLVSECVCVCCCYRLRGREWNPWMGGCDVVRLLLLAEYIGK